MAKMKENAEKVNFNAEENGEETKEKMTLLSCKKKIT